MTHINPPLFCGAKCLLCMLCLIAYIACAFCRSRGFSSLCDADFFQHFFYHIIITIWFQEEKNLRYIDKICVRFQIFSDREGYMSVIENKNFRGIPRCYTGWECAQIKVRQPSTREHNRVVWPRQCLFWHDCNPRGTCRGVLKMCRWCIQKKKCQRNRYSREEVPEDFWYCGTTVQLRQQSRRWETSIRMSAQSDVYPVSKKSLWR